MRDTSYLRSPNRKPWGMRIAGVMVASLGVMCAFGCSPASDGSASSSAEQDAEVAPVELTMEYADGSDMYDHKSIEVTDEAQIGEGAQFVNGLGSENTYVYKGFAHGDGAHYSMYSLYTELVTDEDGMLTAINLTSGNDTWANKWGAMGGRPTIYGTLPDGVTFDCETTTDGDDAILTPALSVEEGSEADNAGYEISGIYFYDVQDDLSTVGMDVEGRRGTTHYDYDATVTIESASAQADDDDDDDEGETAGGRGGSGGKEGSGSESQGGSGRHGESGGSSETTASDDGASKTTEEAQPATDATYDYDTETGTITVRDGAYNLVKIVYTFGTDTSFEEYVVIGGDESAQAYVEANAEVTDLSVPEKVEDTALTNRTKWTYSMLSLMAQREFASWGATFEDTSLYTGGNDGEIGDLDTISGATKTSVPLQSALNQAIEAGYITGISENVHATIDGGAEANDGIDVSAVQQDQTDVVKNDDGTYTITVGFPSGVDESAEGGLQHAISTTGFDLYALGDEDLGTLGVWNLGKGTAGYTPVATYADSSSASGDTDDSYVTYVSDWDYPYNPTITVKDPSVTHVVVSFSIGHETLGIAYDLEAMAQAHDVEAMIEEMDADDADAVAAAREAYDVLTNDVKGTVANFDKLLEAEGE